MKAYGPVLILANCDICSCLRYIVQCERVLLFTKKCERVLMICELCEPLSSHKTLPLHSILVVWSRSISPTNACVLNICDNFVVIVNIFVNITV